VSAWLADNVPSWLLLLGLSVLIAGGAVLIQMYVRRRFPSLKGDAHNDVMRFTFTVIAFLYAFVSGFMINAMWGQINGADARAATEGSAAMQQAHSLTVFDKPDSDRIRQGLLEYVRAAEAEWPLVARGKTYPDADNALQRLYTTYRDVQPRNETQQKFLVVSLNNLDKMSAERTERVTVARTDTGPPWSLWVVQFLTSAMVLGYAIVFGGKSSAVHYAMVAALGVLIATILFLMVELSHPYIGEISTSPQPLHEVAAVLSAPPSQ
jgi:Protein of unknown function (DUF4239)